MFVNFNILNQLGSPAINSNTFANRPAAGQTGRLFVSTDTFEIYRDNGTTWDLIGGPGTSTITGTGTATQVAYFTSSQAIGSSSNLYWDNTNIRLGIGTATPGARLDIHGSNVMAQFNGTTSASNSYIAFQRTGSNVWRVGDNYNSGDNFFELRNSVLSNDALTIQATTNKAAFLAQQTYLGGQAQGALFTYNLTAPAGTTFATPNALSAVNAFLNLSLGGNATLPAGTRQGIEGNSRVSFTGAGTLTMSQGSTLRAYAAITGVHSFAGSAVGTITHVAGMRLCFPDNIGSAINITNNYGLLINDQSAGTGTITYTNRWGIYQEGASDLNYFAANTLIGSTVNNGNKLQVTGNADFTGNVGIGTTSPNGTLHISKSSAQVKITDLGITNPSYNTLLIEASAQNKFSLGVNSTTSQNYALTIDGTTQNVGIGTASPQSILDIRSANLPRLQLVKNGVLSWFLGDTQQDGTNLFSIGTDAGSSRILNINNSGNVGIGTTSPASLLHLYTASSAANVITITNGTQILYLGVNNDGGGSYLFESSNAALRFGTNATERMRITSGGNVLIGTSTDAGQKLQVNGNGRFLGTTLNLDEGTPNSFGERSITIYGSVASTINPAASLYLTQVWNGALYPAIVKATFGTTTGNAASDLVFMTSFFNGTAPQSQEVLRLQDDANSVFKGSIKTGAPTGGTAAAWKLGSRVAATVALDTTQYIELDVGGTLYKLAIVT